MVMNCQSRIKKTKKKQEICIIYPEDVLVSILSYQARLEGTPHFYLLIILSIYCWMSPTMTWLISGVNTFKIISNVLVKYQRKQSDTEDRKEEENQAFMHSNRIFINLQWKIKSWNIGYIVLITKAVHWLCLVFAAGSVVCHSEWGSRNQLPRQQDGDSVHGQQLWHLSLLGQAIYARRGPHQGRWLPGKEDFKGLKQHLISFSNSKANYKNTRNNFCSLCSFLSTHLCKLYSHCLVPLLATLFPVFIWTGTDRGRA